MIGQNKKTATSTEILSYCKDVYSFLYSKNQINYAYFDVTSDTIKSTLEEHNDVFEMYFKKIYLKKEIDLKTINSHLNEELKTALESVANMQKAV